MLAFVALVLVATSFNAVSSFSQLQDTNGTALGRYCPPGFVSNGTDCVCGDWMYNIVLCDEDSQRASIKITHCMTHDQDSGRVIVGGCPQGAKRTRYHKFYYPLPTNVTELNHYMCEQFNSEGLLCGKCKHHFAVPPLTYFNNFKCVNCSDTSNGWVKYLALQYLPTTAVFIIMVVFGFSAVAPATNAFIFFSQTFQVAGLDFIENTLAAQGDIIYEDRIPIKVVGQFYSIWNLNFFYGFVPDFCVRENLNGIQAAAVSYANAGYLLFLIIVLLVCIQLHACNFRPLVWCWRPLHKYFVHFRRAIDPQASVINAFASFILFSSIKFLTASWHILQPSYIYNHNGKRMDEVVLFYDTSVEFLHREHLPLAILAIFILLAFVAIPPVLLLLYPTLLFQRCLTRCKMNCYTLRTFADIFQGCYKDGTNGTRDYRYFAGLYFVLRIVIVLLTFAHVEIYVIGSILTYLFMAILFALLRPYKRDKYNVLDTLMFTNMAVIYIFILFHAVIIFFTAQPSEALLTVTDILTALPLLYFIVLIVHRLLRNCVQKVRFQRNTTTPGLRQVPHQLENQAEYDVHNDHEQRHLMQQDNDLVGKYGSLQEQ